MKITLITVGKIKEKYLKDAIAEYSKRLGRYCKLEIVEVADEKTPDHASETVENAIRDKEGERILKYVKEDSYVITLEIRGKMLTSEELSEKVDTLGVQGRRNVSTIFAASSFGAMMTIVPSHARYNGSSPNMPQTPLTSG